MNYPIWIGATNTGTPLIGAREVDSLAVVVDQIYGSQMKHRCTARTAKGAVVICTPTEAKARGYHILARFPQANGSFSKRNF
jgi:hypothetical protein